VPALASKGAIRSEDDLAELFNDPDPAPRRSPAKSTPVATLALA
jgi:hypothetical protein